MHKERGKLDRAREFYEKCLKTYKDVAARDWSNHRVRVDAAQVYVGFGDIHFKQDERDEALANYEKDLPVLRERVAADSANVLL